MKTLIKALILAGMVWILMMVLSFVINQKIERNSTIGLIKPASARSAIETEGAILETETRDDHYRRLGGKFLTRWVEPHLETIDKVLLDRGYANDEQLIQTMFYVGEHESHWRMEARGGFNHNGIRYAPIGVFQFLEGTFKSVNPTGDVNNLEDQIHAFVTMYERGRLGEFQVMAVCNWKPCL